MLLRGKRLPLIMTRHIVHQYRRAWFSRLSFQRSMVGRRLPVLQTAIGMAYLAFCGEAEREQILHCWPPATSPTTSWPATAWRWTISCARHAIAVTARTT